MTHKIGHSAVLDGVEVHSWGGTPHYFEYFAPSGALIFKFKGDRIKPHIRGTDGKTYQIVERHRIDRPTKYHIEGVESVSFDGTKVIVDPNFTPKFTLAEAKEARKDELRGKGKELLAKTDWRVLMALELGNPIPSAIATRRSNIRSRILEMEAEIDALTTLEELSAYVESNWPAA